MAGKIVPFEKSPSVQDRAAQWLVELDYRALSEAEAAELKSWLAESPEHRRVFHETALVYGQAEVLQILADLQPLESESTDLQPTESGSVFAPSIRPKGGWSIAAALVLSFALALILATDSGLFNGQKQSLVYATEVGGREVAKLEDGSTLTLNTDTALRVEFTDTLRKVVLKRGEAFFSVASDLDRPFVVDTGEGLVTAVGTAFSVYKREMDVEVSVTEGRVRVEAARALEASRYETEAEATDSELSPKVARNILDQKRQSQGVKDAVLGSGQVATFSRTIERVETIAPEKLSRKLIWQQGMLAFEGESLEEVIDQFSRYTTLEISIKDPELRSIAVDGYFKSNDIAGMLNSLRLNFGIEIVRSDNGHIVLQRS